MPNKPPRLAIPGQQTAAERRKQFDQQRSRLEYRRWYSTARWRKSRDWFLSLNPLCKHCELEGYTTAATEVDHRVPHRGDEQLFWDCDNWSPLCQSCHSRKTAGGG